VVAVDLPGHGATPALPGALTLERLVDDLQEWLVEQQLTGADLVGSSMGARMVLELARQRRCRAVAGQVDGDHLPSRSERLEHR
jgi:pimeloyl-ACP methyl ester carboxylesterase